MTPRISRLISLTRNCGSQQLNNFLIIECEDLAAWIERLPLMHIDKHRIFVHAGIDPNFSLDEQDPQDVIWKIYDDYDNSGHGQRHVVHGHFPPQWKSFGGMPLSPSYIFCLVARIASRIQRKTLAIGARRHII
jgi:hypothetical protein